MIQSFRRFQKVIKNCAKTPYKWQASDVCLRASNCFQVVHDRIRFRRLSDSAKSKQKEIEAFKKMKNLEHIDFPCPKSKPYACGPEGNHCSLNKEACDLFSLKKNAVNPKDKQIRHSGIKQCGNDLTLIGLVKLYPQQSNPSVSIF